MKRAVLTTLTAAFVLAPTIALAHTDDTGGGAMALLGVAVLTRLL